MFWIISKLYKELVLLWLSLILQHTLTEMLLGESWNLSSDDWWAGVLLCALSSKTRTVLRGSRRRRLTTLRQSWLHMIDEWVFVYSAIILHLAGRKALTSSALLWTTPSVAVVSKRQGFSSITVSKRWCLDLQYLWNDDILYKTVIFL